MNWLGIDPDGDVMLCEYDWKRTIKHGNIITDSIDDIFKQKLELSERVNKCKESVIPCNVCSFCRIKDSYRGKDFKCTSVMKQYMEEAEI
jgi:radical SAM protein with 4Fe4S-binding SPASM domain